MDNKHVSFNNIDEDVRLKEALDDLFSEDFNASEKNIDINEYTLLNIPKVETTSFSVPDLPLNNDYNIKIEDKIPKRRNEKKFVLGKKIIIGMLTLIFVMALGYTLLTDKVIINGTASVNGMMNIDFNCNIIQEGVLNSTGSGTCNINKNKIETISTLYMPTDSVNYMILITNNGNFPVTLTKILSSNNKLINSNSNGDEIYLNDEGFLNAKYTIYHNQKEYIGDKYTSNQNITLEPNETIIVIINHNWLSLNEQPEIIDKAIINYDVMMTFEQLSR